MEKSREDPFMARLNRLNGPEVRAKRPLETQDYPRDAQNSVFLPMVAMCLLIVGGTAFALMLTLPDPDGMSVAATTLERLSSK